MKTIEIELDDLDYELLDRLAAEANMDVDDFVGNLIHDIIDRNTYEN